MSTRIRSFCNLAPTKALLPAAIALSLNACVAYVPSQTYDQPYQQPQYSQPRYAQPAENDDSNSNDNYADDPSNYQPEVEVRVAVAPPPLPVYDQPPCPEYGYLWTPGYWSYGGGGYYWVPGTWVRPPQVGALWTPGYWGWSSGFYLFHPGYWGPHVGFYGGVNYGGGYIGRGYVGGRWDRDRFSYNRAVNNVNTTLIHNTYNQTVINNVTVNRVSYNGGAGGVSARPTRDDELAARDRRIPLPPQQLRHINESRQNPALQVSYNQGRPPIAATPRAAVFNAPNVMSARGAPPMPPPREGGPVGRASNGTDRPDVGPGQNQNPGAFSGRTFNDARPGDARPGDARPGDARPSAAPNVPSNIGTPTRPAPGQQPFQRADPQQRQPQPREQVEVPQQHFNRPQGDARPQVPRPQGDARPQVPRPQPQRPQAPPPQVQPPRPQAPPRQGQPVQQTPAAHGDDRHPRSNR
jgi:hypothetical protein